MIASIISILFRDSPRKPLNLVGESDQLLFLWSQIFSQFEQECLKVLVSFGNSFQWLVSNCLCSRCVHVCSELIRVAPSPLTWSRLECSDLCRCTNPICPPHAFGFVRGGSRRICPGWPTGFVTGVRFGFVHRLDLDLSRVSVELILGWPVSNKGWMNFISRVR